MTTAATTPRPRRLRRTLAAALLGTTMLTAGAALTVPSVFAEPPPPPITPDFSQALPGSFAELVEQVKPAVVTVTTRVVAADAHPAVPGLPEGTPFDEFFRRFGQPFGNAPHGPQGPQGPQEQTGMGSGFIIDPDGYVVTNQHVVDGARAVTVTLNDGTELEARVVGTDERTDLALLEVDADRNLPYLAFGDSDGTRVGDWVVAVGNPFGLESSVTAGIVSARGRDIRHGPYDDYLQIDAPINRGSSGGPLFDTDGRVIGINTAIFSPSGGNVGIGFAIPAAMAEPVIADLREQGHVDRGWLGVQIQDVTPEIAESLGLDEARGALVAEVVPGSPAAAAGLERGDVVLRYGDDRITSTRELTREVGYTESGSTVPLTVWRDDEERTIDVTIAPLEHDAKIAAADVPAEPTDTALGLQVAALDPALRRQFGLDESVTGVVVTGVDAPAAESGIRPGDVIVEVGGEPVADPADLAQGVEQAQQAGRDAVLLLVNRQGDERFVAVTLRNA